MKQLFDTRPPDPTNPHEVKERLRPTSPAEAWAETQIERLPRTHLHVRLLPLQGLETIDAEQGRYRSLGDAPTFQLQTAAPLAAGWYYLETALTRNNGSREARLVVQTAAGQHDIPIPSILRGTVREVVHLPAGVNRLLWMPTQAPGYLTQAPLLLHKISSFESTVRRAHRVISDLWRFRKSQPQAQLAGLSWSLLFRNLQKAYRASAAVRIARLYSTDAQICMSAEEMVFRSDTDTLPSRALSHRPLVSLIMPLQSADEHLLQLTLDSILKQAYPHWECVVACQHDASQKALNLLQAAAQSDVRLKALSCPDGVHGSVGLLNQALSAAQGEWLMRINPHDRLPKTSLLHIVHEANDAPSAQMIYGDDADLDAQGQQSQARFKPQWNPDLFVAHNYIGHPVAHRRQAMLAMGGYAQEFQGAEDHELSLRFTQALSPQDIRHVPKILYLCSTHKAVPGDPRQAHVAGRRALEHHLVKDGGNVRLVEDGPAFGLYRIHHVLPVNPPLVSIIIPTRDKAEVLRACVQSIQNKTTYPHWEMLIVDNGSVEPAAQAYLANLQNDPRIRVLRYDAPFNYSAINNFAVQHAKGDVLALLNNDVEVIAPEWLTDMVSHALRPEVGAVGAKLLYPDDTVQHAGVVVRPNGATAHAHRFLQANALGYCNMAVLTQNVTAVTGACLVVRKHLYQELGGLDAVNLKVAYNDIDFCVRLERAGYRNLFTPYATLYHHESLTRGVDDTTSKLDIRQKEFGYVSFNWNLHPRKSDLIKF